MTILSLVVKKDVYNIHTSNKYLHKLNKTIYFYYFPTFTTYVGIFCAKNGGADPHRRFLGICEKPDGVVQTPPAQREQCEVITK